MDTGYLIAALITGIGPWVVAGALVLASLLLIVRLVVWPRHPLRVMGLALAIAAMLLLAAILVPPSGVLAIAGGALLALGIAGTIVGALRSRTATPQQREAAQGPAPSPPEARRAARRLRRRVRRASPPSPVGLLVTGTLLVALMLIATVLSG